MEMVYCGNPECRTKPVIEESPTLDYHDRTPCPDCGSLVRAHFISATDVAHARHPGAFGVGTLELKGGVSLGTATTDGPPARVRLSALDGVQLTRELTVRMVPLADRPDAPCMIEVCDADGQVLVTAIGDTPMQALLRTFRNMVPPSSRNYEPPPEDL